MHGVLSGSGEIVVERDAISLYIVPNIWLIAGVVAAISLALNLWFERSVRKMDESRQRFWLLLRIYGSFGLILLGWLAFLGLRS